MSAFEDDYLSVTEAAATLHVAPSTIRRWIHAGELPASRIGKRRFALRSFDVIALRRPVQPDTGTAAPNPLPKRTQREIQEGLDAMETLQRHSREIFGSDRENRFSPSWEILNELRDERTRQLG